MPDADEMLRCAKRYVRAGFTDLIFMIYHVGDESVRVAEAAAKALPRLRTIG